MWDIFAFNKNTFSYILNKKNKTFVYNCHQLYFTRYIRNIKKKNVYIMTTTFME